MIRPTVVKLHALFALFAASLLLLPLGTAQAKSGPEIDASVDEALQTFVTKVKSADSYLQGAKGVLVMADVKKAGLGVGMQWGEGALRIDSKTVEYYKMQTGSVGMQAGYQTSNFVILFLTDDAVKAFRASQGWSGGLESGITVVDASTPTMSLDSMKAKSSIVVFVIGKQGLMAGWSAKGTKFSKIDG
jgi:lipid-binding SYLF domain-containing protein